MRLRSYRVAAIVTPLAVVGIASVLETLRPIGVAAWDRVGGVARQFGSIVTWLALALIALLVVRDALRPHGVTRRLLGPIGYYALDAFSHFSMEVSEKVEAVIGWLRWVAAAVFAFAVLFGWLAHDGSVALPVFLRGGPLAVWYHTAVRYFLEHPQHIIPFVVVAGLITAVVISAAIGLLVLLVSLYAHVAGGIGEALGLSWHSLWAPQLWSRPPIDGRGRRVLVCQISDLHLSAGGKMPYEIEAGEAAWPEGMPKPTSDELRRRMTSLFESIAAERPALVVATGDITDLGEPEQWLEAEVVLAALPTTIGRMLVPGNHDVSINTTAKPDTSLAARRAREARMVEALSLLERGEMRPPLTLKAEQWGDIGPDDGALFLPKYFPRCVELPGGDAGELTVRVIALDSNRYESRFVLSNAIGLVGAQQLARLDEELATASGPVIVALHHHVAHLPGSPGGGGRVERDAKEAFLLALDGDLLLEQLAAYHRRDPSARNAVLVLHGHRHLAFLGLYVSPLGGEVLVHAHASSTLGHEVAGRVDGILRYAAIGLTPNGRFFVETREVERASHERMSGVRPASEELSSDVRLSG